MNLQLTPMILRWAGYMMDWRRSRGILVIARSAFGNVILPYPKEVSL